MISIGVAQIPNSLEVEKNFSSIMRFLKHFKSEKVDLVIFPECGLSGFSAKMKECTSDFLSKYLEEVQSWSKITGIDVILPTAIVETDKIYNSGFWFKKEARTQFYKIGLTESEKKFFSIPSHETKKIFDVKGLKCAVLICKEAEQEPSLYMNQDEVDFIIWPGYWGWTTECKWQEVTDEKPNQVFINAASWKLPIIQSNFSFNDLGGHAGSGPEGLSVVINSDNSLFYRGSHLKESGFIVDLAKIQNRPSVVNCRELIL